MSMNELNSELNKIQETKTLLKEAIINKGQEVLDTDSFRSYVDKVSNITTGIDTSDATATPDDIVAGKTAYANGNKVEGTITEYKAATGTILPIDTIGDMPDENIVQVGKMTSSDRVYRVDSYNNLQIPYETLAEMVGLTSEKLLVGNTVLGKSGTATSDATATANDIADGKTAYVNGNKISGKLFDGRSTFASVSLDEVREEDLHYEAEMNKIMLTAYGTYSGEFIANGDTNIHSSIDGSVLANKINLSSDKIIEGNTILGIEGTGKTSEDLQEQLDTQDTIIQQLQEELANKTSGARPNIFIQENEPTIKKGIWVKSTLDYDIIDDHKIFTPTAHLSKNISSSGFMKVDSWLYIFGGYWYNAELGTGEVTDRCFKINLDTFEEVELASIPDAGNKLYDMECVYIEGKIYMTTGAGGSTNMYVYDIATNSWTGNAITSMTTPSKGYTIYTYNNILYIFANSNVYTLDLDTFTATKIGTVSGLNTSYLTRLTPYSSTGNVALITGHWWANNYPIGLFYLDNLVLNGRMDDFKQQAPVFCIPGNKTVYSFSGLDATNIAVTGIYRYDNIENHSGKVKLLGNVLVPIKGCAYCVYNDYLYTFGGYIQLNNNNLPSARCDYIYKIPLNFNDRTFNNAIVLNDRNQYIKDYTVELYDSMYTTLSNINVYENGTVNSNRPVYLGDGHNWLQVFGGEE